MIKTQYQIKQINQSQMPVIIEWANAEGWNTGFHDGECFYQADPNGFWIGKLGDEIICCGSAVCYDDAYAFCGLYIVAPQFRGMGYGIELTQARLQYIGDRNAGLDGVIDMVDRYARLGYRIAHDNVRYEGVAKAHQFNHKYIKPINDAKFSDLLIYDRELFPAERKAFLQCWIHQPQSLSYVYLQDNCIKGYVVARKCHQGYKIAPLFADTTDIAYQLFHSVCNDIVNEPIFLDIPKPNADAIALANQAGMQAVFETKRMYLRSDPKLDLNRIYGITSFELG